MSANNFARPSWVDDNLRQNHNVVLPQYTDAEFHARNASMSKKALVNLYMRSQTEYNRLSGVAERITSEIKYLRAGTLTEEEQKELDVHEWNEMIDCECYDEPNITKQDALDGFQGQHELNLEARENVRIAERIKAEVVAQQTAAGGVSSTA